MTTPVPQSWQERVAYAPGGAFAYRPRQVLVAVRDLAAALAVISDPTLFGATPDPVGAPVVGYQLIVGDFDVILVVEELRGAGLDAQPNHVLFADAGLTGNPFSGNPFSGNPFSGNPFSGNPFSGNPFSGNPFSGNPFSGNPFSGNPFPVDRRAGGVYGKPTFAGPAHRTYSTTGRGRSAARPAPPGPSAGARPIAGGAPLVAVLDTPLPAAGTPDAPWLLDNCERGLPALKNVAVGVPDEDGDGFLDRIAGHGIFVAGRVAQVAPTCSLRVVEVLTNLGDGDELTVARALADLAGTVDIVNLSFGGYALRHMGCLARAVRRVQILPGPGSAGAAVKADSGGVVVTSAGNDATWAAPYPACLPDVVSVAALGPNGPAPFTNYGPWVRACAAGVDVESAFFHWNGAQSTEPDGDPDSFVGTATWSGTSFAAPLVAGRIARLVAGGGRTPKQAVRDLLDAPGSAALPYLGTVVTG